jgi:hypothetical protein
MITPFLVGFEIRFQKIGKKEQLENHKHNEQLDQDNDPNLSPPVAHVFKSLDIEMANLQKRVASSHPNFSINIVFLGITAF